MHVDGFSVQRQPSIVRSLSSGERPPTFRQPSKTAFYCTIAIERRAATHLQTAFKDGLLLYDRYRAASGHPPSDSLQRRPSIVRSLSSGERPPTFRQPSKTAFYCTIAIERRAATHLQTAFKDGLLLYDRYRAASGHPPSDSLQRRPSIVRSLSSGERPPTFRQPSKTAFYCTISIARRAATHLQTAFKDGLLLYDRYRAASGHPPSDSLQRRPSIVRSLSRGERPPTFRQPSKTAFYCTISIGRRAATHLQPSDVEEELEEGEDRHVDVDAAAGVEKLASHQAGEEERVDGYRHDLRTRRDNALRPMRSL